MKNIMLMLLLLTTEHIVFAPAGCGMQQKEQKDQGEKKKKEKNKKEASFQDAFYENQKGSWFMKAQQKEFIAFLNLISYNYARIARAFEYNIQDINQLVEITIDLTNNQTFNNSVEKLQAFTDKKLKFSNFLSQKEIELFQQIKELKKPVDDQKKELNALNKEIDNLSEGTYDLDEKLKANLDAKNKDLGEKKTKLAEDEQKINDQLITLLKQETKNVEALPEALSIDEMHAEISQIIDFIEAYYQAPIPTTPQNEQNEQKKRIGSLKAELVAKKTVLSGVIELFEKQALFFPNRIVEAAKALGITTIKPFLGYAGKPKNKLHGKEEGKDSVEGREGVDNDIRGVIATGKDLVNDKAITYVCFHGSCQELDWDTNLDMDLIAPSGNFLPALKPFEELKVHRGFGVVIQKTLNEIEGEFSFRKVLGEPQGDVIFTGHSLGAALASLASTYYKAQHKDNKGVKVYGWFLSQPRVFNKTGAEAVDKLFGIEKENNNSKNVTINKPINIVRQNVFNDPVPQSFTSPENLVFMVRRTINTQQVLFQNQIKSLLNNLLKLTSINITGYIPESVDTLIFNYYNWTDSSKVNLYASTQVTQYIVDNFLLRLDPTVKDLVLLSGNQIFIEQYLNSKTGYYLGKATASFIQFIKNSLGHSASDTEKHEIGRTTRLARIYLIKLIEEPHELENLLFSVENTEYPHTEKNNPKRKSDYSKEFIQGNLKNGLKNYLIKMLCKKAFMKELSLYGGLLEGIMVFGADYGDTGLLLFDHLPFHPHLERREDILAVLGSGLLSGSLFGNLLKKVEEAGLEYFAPYHYGRKQIGGSFDPYLVTESDLVKLYSFGHWYENQTDQEKAEFYYDRPLLKQQESTKSQEKSPKNQSQIGIGEAQCNLNDTMGNQDPRCIIKKRLNDQKIELRKLLSINKLPENDKKEFDKFTHLANHDVPPQISDQVKLAHLISFINKCLRLEIAKHDKSTDQSQMFKAKIPENTLYHEGSDEKIVIISSSYDYNKKHLHQEDYVLLEMNGEIRDRIFEKYKKTIMSMLEVLSQITQQPAQQSHEYPQINWILYNLHEKCINDIRAIIEPNAPQEQKAQQEEKIAQQEERLQQTNVQLSVNDRKLLFTPRKEQLDKKQKTKSDEERKNEELQPLQQFQSQLGQVQEKEVKKIEKLDEKQQEALLQSQKKIKKANEYLESIKKK